MRKIFLLLHAIVLLAMPLLAQKTDKAKVYKSYTSPTKTIRRAMLLVENHYSSVEG